MTKQFKMSSAVSETHLYNTIQYNTVEIQTFGDAFSFKHVLQGVRWVNEPICFNALDS